MRERRAERRAAEKARRFAATRAIRARNDCSNVRAIWHTHTQAYTSTHKHTYVYIPVSTGAWRLELVYRPAPC